MNTLADKQRRWLSEQLERMGRGARSGLANHLNVRPDAITRMTNLSNSKETREISLEELVGMAEFFKEEPPGLRDARQKAAEAAHTVVKVVGRIGAGQEILPELEQLPPEGLFQIEVPFPVPDNTLAFEVEGESMWPRYDPGDVVLCWKEGTNANEVIGWEAAVMTDQGQRYLKRILHGSKAKLFNLESFNAPVIRDVKLTWISKVQLVVRAGEWRQIGRAAQVRISKKLAGQR